MAQPRWNQRELLLAARAQAQRLLDRLEAQHRTLDDGLSISSKTLAQGIRLFDQALNSCRQALGDLERAMVELSKKKRKDGHV